MSRIPSMRNERTFNPAHAERLDAPERRVWLPPEEVLERLSLTPGVDVADVGAGTGYFAIPIAGAVAPGRVYAVDFELCMLDILRSRATGRSNIELIEGTAEQTTIPAHSCDRVLLANLWHELDKRELVLRECARILRIGGQIVILDWRTDVEQPPGPPLPHRVPPNEVERLLVSEGWIRPRTSLVGTYSYVVAAERKVD